MKVVAIVQARMGSVRLPGKVMKLISGVPMIELLLLRLKSSRLIDQIVVATSVNPNNEVLCKHVRSLGFDCELGSETDVLGRYVDAAIKYNASIVVRITGDCPLVDPHLVDECIEKFKTSKVNFLSNTMPATFPDGLDVAVMDIETLIYASKSAHSPYDREHVTSFIRNSPNLRLESLTNDQDLSHLRWTVDEPADYEYIKNIFDLFHPKVNFGWREVLERITDSVCLPPPNMDIPRNRGANMSTGQKLWTRAKSVIPGGNMLLSKRAEMFAPAQWPAYFSKASGCRIWDLDDREYIDMSLMGVGTNILGYGHAAVDQQVMKAIGSGNMSTLNAPEEVLLAERLVSIHPWADMVRFARSGGEANAIAVRIARAAAGREGVAVCGYHGWHDWYMAANLSRAHELDGHLLPGLEPNGVPRQLVDTIFPFNYNDFNALEKLIDDHNIGVIKMEVMRNIEPKENFLQKVRDLASKKGLVLIFDECTSGFRQNYGGLHKKFKVDPDIAIFGKALGNGYAISSVIGRRDVMEAAQTTFISSTFWTERIGTVAALATLEVMESERSWERITENGTHVAEIWKKLGSDYNLSIDVFGLPSIVKFKFNSDKNLAYKTLITQEMLKKGYLSTNAFYASIAHDNTIFENYRRDLAPIFGLIKECEDGRDISSLLNGPVCHSDFKRLN